MSFHRRQENAAYPFVAEECFEVRVATGHIHAWDGTRFVDASETLLSCLSNAVGARSSGGLAAAMRASGRAEGERAAREVREQLSAHYGQDLDELPLVLLLTAVERAWGARGMGRLEVGVEHAPEGVFVLRVEELCAAMTAHDAVEFAGAFLSACFCALTGAELAAHFVAGEAGADSFVLTGAARLEQARAAAGDETLGALLASLACARGAEACA